MYKRQAVLAAHLGVKGVQRSRDLLIRAAPHSSFSPAKSARSSPVSYTHLDVYKRQGSLELVQSVVLGAVLCQLVIQSGQLLVLDFMQLDLEGCILASQLGSAVLDVYKRQGLWVRFHD